MFWKQALVLAMGAVVGCGQPASDEEVLGTNESDLTSCIGCPAAYHPVELSCGPACSQTCSPGPGGGWNTSSCEPDHTPSFGQCGTFCPWGYHSENSGCDNISCGKSCLPGQNTNTANCVRNVGNVFGACGTSCPLGYRRTASTCDGRCGPCAISAGPNLVTCEYDHTCDTYTQNVIGYGQMGYTDGCQRRDVCAPGLTPHNVDSTPGFGYPRAAEGVFSCWYNTPDVNCSLHTLIHDYVNVRACYTRPNGSKVNYGCNDC